MFVWALVEMVGGSLACESIDGPCAATLVVFFAGVVAIGVIGSTLGWTINWIVKLARRGR